MDFRTMFSFLELVFVLMYLKMSDRNDNLQKVSKIYLFIVFIVYFGDYLSKKKIDGKFSQERPLENQVRLVGNFVVKRVIYTSIFR